MTAKSTHTVHLVDASPYIFRAYYALPDSITDPSGTPVNAVLGFANFLVGYVADHHPSHLALAFDGSLSTSFRNELLPEYKAQRGLPPPELEAQLDACLRFGQGFGAATFIDDRYEADDLVGTLWKQVRAAGHHVVVVSNDKDLAQLVDDGTEFFDAARDRRHDAAGVHASFGVRPDQIPDFLGLAGDAVDNIPGVAGVGKKTAIALLEAFEHLEDIYADLERVAGLPLRGAAGTARKLAEQREAALLSRELATIALDAPASATLTELRWRGPAHADLDPLLDELGFGRLRERLPWRD